MGPMLIIGLVACLYVLEMLRPRRSPIYLEEYLALEDPSEEVQISGLNCLTAGNTDRRRMAPMVFPQLYRCPMIQSKQPIQDEFLSQAHEDEWLYDKIFSKLPFDQRFGGTFVEIGAFDGRTNSTTWYFEKKWDWRGILIEGDPTKSVLLRGNQSGRQNCAIFTAGVCNFTDELCPSSLEKGKEIGTVEYNANPLFFSISKGGNGEDWFQNPISLFSLVPSSFTTN